jgi:predicted O-methyltransferase YrrM
MNIEQALIDIGMKNDLDPDALIAYAYEDGIGGYHSIASLAKWPCGSIWEVEGRVLYALVRATRPQITAEIGVFLGCGSSHIAAALQKNGSGKHHGLDTHQRQRVSEKDYDTGGLIPPDLRAYVTLHYEDGMGWIKQHKVDFIFDDGNHSASATREAWELAAKQLKPGGFIVTHDATHFLAGKAVQEGLNLSGLPYQLYSIQPSDCGLALWRKPFDKIVEPEPETVSQQLETALNEGREKAQAMREDWQRFVPPNDDAPEPEPDIASMTRAELRDYAELMGIEDAQTRSKKDLLEALNGD